MWLPKKRFFFVLRAMCPSQAAVGADRLLFVMKMAASGPTCAAGETEPEPEPEPAPGSEQETDPWSVLDPVVKREPAVKLLSPVSGPEPLAWSADHRLAVGTTTGLSVLELVCDVQVQSAGIMLHRTSIPLPGDVYKLKVGSEQEVARAKRKFSSSPDPTVNQLFRMDKVMNPDASCPRGLKYASWSPLGCDLHGRCVLAALTLDGRLMIHSSRKRLQWTPEADLTQLYGDMLKSRGYSPSPQGTVDSPRASLDDLDELRRRYYMQTPVRMEWSGVCSTQRVQTNNTCKDEGTVLLAVLMENGDVVVWQFRLPLQGKDSVISCNTIASGVALPSVLSWWEYEQGGRKMSGLIIGSTAGTVKILPVNLKAVKGYFTLRQPVVLWQEVDKIPVAGVKCVTLFHPHQKCNCSLVVAARGSYIFWCLLVITKAGLNVHNSHVTSLHNTPIISMSACRHGGTIFTCSLDGHVKKLTPKFTDVAVEFKQEELALPEGVAGCRVHGMSVSASGAYMALLTTEGMINGHHPVGRHYQVQFVTLKTPYAAAMQILESGVPNLFQQWDLLDLLRWKVLMDKRIPFFLHDELDDKLHSAGSTYLWRFKLFLCRVLYQSLQKAPSEARWKPSSEESKRLLLDDDETEAGQGDETRADGGDCEAVESSGPSIEEQMNEVLGLMEAAESHLTREHMKQVLGEVYLHTLITENTSIPTRGLCDFLSSDATSEDRAAKVLIGHIFKKMNKQTFPEYCSLCREVLPFTDRKQATCTNRHIWLRCVLSYQACQSMTYKRCLQQDSIARLPGAEDPEWIQRILQGPCPFCDAPFI
ncbi:general transcription factor 3C polypeptide 4 [Denticeps clupeoides]|uniref:General transcription factor IIIC, polypeptide 4 n=1 Tax=Denticeps clupeoides TaxID=299321 RepID=A0AAY4C6Z0_9TELE|nr:general transcription factor 3C polypeptide 4 [Denticeps clupeoides]